MRKNKNLNKRNGLTAGYILFELAYPLFVYYFATVFVMIIAGSYLGYGKQSYMLCQIVVGLFTLPLMYLGFYKPDRDAGLFTLTSRKEEKNARASFSISFLLKYLEITMIVLLYGTAVNNIILMSPIAAASEGYAQANSAFYGSTIVLELLGSGFLTPMLEEMTFRGIIYERMRRTVGYQNAMIMSALFFAVVHFNWVQFLYALIIGLLFSVILEKTGKLSYCITGHIAINVLAILRSELGWLAGTVDRSLSAWLISAGLLLFAVAGIWNWYKRE